MDKSKEEQEETENTLNKEKEELYQQIWKEMNEITQLEEEAFELEYKNSKVQDELEKINAELELENLKREFYDSFNPLEKVFEIDLFQEYGAIRQYELRFPPKYNLNSVRKPLSY